MVIPFYILIHAEKGQGDFVAEEANKIKGVKMAHHVTGAIDVILYAEADDFSDIRRIREAVFGIQKVVRTETAIHVLHQSVDQTILSTLRYFSIDANLLQP